MNRSFLLKAIVHVFLAILLFVSVAFTYAWQQLSYTSLSVSTENKTFVIMPGTSLKKFTKQLQNAGIYSHPNLLSWFATARGYANNIKAGEYEVGPRMSAIDLLDTVVAGKVAQYTFTIVEGWRSADIIINLQRHPKIQPALKGLSNENIIQKLNIMETHLEGLFYPDTYHFTANTTDLEFLRRAYIVMQQKLQVAWENRAPECILNSPYEALILASIIEKESNVYDEYSDISGVFQRRIVKNMRLQADPTVIYALGEEYTGKLFKGNLQIKSPYNTYANAGLPPTPIANPGMHALSAALHPKQSDSLYFVANSDGRHVFSKDLVGHNQAVVQFRD